MSRLDDLRHLRCDLEGQCFVCGRPSVLVRSIDRFVHLDGSDNQPCWRTTLITGGDGLPYYKSDEDMPELPYQYARPGEMRKGMGRCGW
ncbi:hypothetical protein AS032_14650 [Rhodococcus qingshengii]|nr:hypothetical protein AS032_14650 [Rhodococcus qingshengii]SCC37413.1 hypothetical protein GA0061093_107152 [Rhodococcus qingshengii]